MSMDRLPEEVLQLILEQVPTDPDPATLCKRLAPEQWCYPRTLVEQLIRPLDSTRVWQLLRVQRRWARILVRVLLAYVPLTRPHHARAVLARLRAEPHLGRSVRALWLHDGAPQEWAEILKCTPRVETLYINLDLMMGSPDVVQNAFWTRVSPQRVYLHWTKYRSYTSVNLFTNIRLHWLKLRYLHLSDAFTYVGNLALFFRDASALRSIEIKEHVGSANTNATHSARARLQERQISLIARNDLYKERQERANALEAERRQARTSKVEGLKDAGNGSAFLLDASSFVMENL
ncbi:hypothetical protein PsYK624_080150 [Phanerochaete sordida]|uniref:F-box domain-containing protein n=1 Tax=Phanerochaete sordida TaxID=48140 RepID=A0A9P3GDM4_9APHY|nr:hypothetical protein PsYK624_080150 [Phanerochaete sordida]